jgi:outer membrane autotransporter protein
MGSLTGPTIKVSQGTLETGAMTVRNGTLQIDPLSTVHVTGNYTQGVAGVLELGIGGTAPGTYGQLTVDGTASLTGLLRIMPFNGYVPVIGDTQTVVQAGSVTGQFAALENVVWPLLRPVLSYDDPQTVDLVWTPILLAPFAGTPNQQSLAANLDGAVADPRMRDLQNFLYFLPTNMVPLALDVIAPEDLVSLFAMRFAGMEGRAGGFMGRVQELRRGSCGFSANRLSLYEQTGNALELVSTRGLTANPICYDMCDPSPDNPWGVYVEGVGEFAHVGGDANAAGYHLRGGGLTVGLDRRVNDQLVLGVSLGYEHVEGDLTGNGDVDLNNGHLTGYALWYGANWYAAGMVGGGYNDYDSQRATFDGFARGETKGTEFTGLLTAGYDWRRGEWLFGPQATVQYKWVNIGDFAESGSLAAMYVPEQSEDALHTQLGAHLTRSWEVGKVTLRPDVSVAWRHEFLDSSNALVSQFANGAGSLYTVSGPDVARDSVALGIGLTIQWTPTIGTYLNYSTELGRDNYQPHTINGGISVRF